MGAVSETIEEVRPSDSLSSDGFNPIPRLLLRFLVVRGVLLRGILCYGICRPLRMQYKTLTFFV